MAWLLQNWVEIVGNALAFLDIYLIYRNSVWNWPVGILNCVFYIAMFLPARLYADTSLQVVYVVLSVYGWWWWLGGRTRIAPPIRRYGDPGGDDKTYWEALILFVGEFRRPLASDLALHEQ